MSPIKSSLRCNCILSTARLGTQNIKYFYNTRALLGQSFSKRTRSNAKILHRNAKLVLHVYAMANATLQRTTEWGFEKNASVSKFEANVRLLMYASMYSGILQVMGAEEAAKAIFNACIVTCEKVECRTESLCLQPLQTMNEHALKLKQDPNFESLAMELQNACEYAQDFITQQQNVLDVSPESVKSIRFQSDSSNATQNGLRIALFLSKLGGQLQAQGYDSEANWLYQNVHQMERKIVQQQNMFMLSNPVHEVAKMLLRRKDDQDVGKIAKCIYGGAIEFWDSSFGPNHPDMYSMYVGLAEIILDLGECDNHPYNTQDRIQHLAEYIQQKHRGTGVLPDYYI